MRKRLCEGLLGLFEVGVVVCGIIAILSVIPENPVAGALFGLGAVVCFPALGAEGISHMFKALGGKG